MSTRQGSPEPLGTGENRGPLSLGTSTPQRNHTYIFGVGLARKEVVTGYFKISGEP